MIPLFDLWLQIKSPANPRTRRAQVRMYFAAYGNPNNVLRPPSPIHLRFLRAIADGVDPNTLPGLERADIRTLTKEACQRINARSPGRNAQRKLVQAYFATQSTQTATTGGGGLL
jgi:hypothetical protein